LNDRERMNYQERLKAAAEITLAADSRAADAPLDVSKFGVTATLKPYQVEGVSWLIRRYTLGVNVVLGTVMVQPFLFLCEVAEKT
jgi:SNF2 family DNA or RNA helicase